VFTATKSAVDAITGILAKELGPRKIRVNSINPGMIETQGVQVAGLDEGDFRKWVAAQLPLGRIGQGDDIAPTAVYLACSDSKYFTGETIRLTGGIL
jgi:3-oxoacyl-[acyl-carrier protein] reductase